MPDPPAPPVWKQGAVIAALIAAVAGLIPWAYQHWPICCVPPPLPEPPARGVVCKAAPSQRPATPAGFDLGYPNRCAEYLYVDADDICDYCRLVGDGNTLRCTLGTKTGLNGLSSEDFRLEGGAPYPGECQWVEPEKGVPALEGTMGDHHDRLSITPVRVVGGHFKMGPTSMQLKK